MRTINETHNFLYCEFVTDFIVFFDHLKDPFQVECIRFYFPPEELDTNVTCTVSASQCDPRLGSVHRGRAQPRAVPSEGLLWLGTVFAPSSAATATGQSGKDGKEPPQQTSQATSLLTS